MFLAAFDRLSLQRCRSSSNPRMNSLIYRSCHNGIIESGGDYWGQQAEHHSCRSSTDLFGDDSTAELNLSRSTKDETFSRSAATEAFVYI